MLILLAVSVYGAIITYDTNTITDFDYKVVPTFICTSASFTSTVTFSGTFANIPKVILSFDRFDLSTSTNFELSITSTTQTGFSLLMNCPTGNRVYRVVIRWYAIDDSHLEVINSFNVASPTLTKTFSHSNANALIGYVSITSLKVTGVVNFKLSISSLTASSVTTTLTSNTNLGQIGYQIILGVNSAFDISDIQTTTSNYSSPAIPISINKWLLTPYTGFNYANTDGIRLVKTIASTATTNNYTIGNWDGSYAGNTHLPIWVPYEYIVVSEAFKIEHMNIRTYEDAATDVHQGIEMVIQQTGDSYSTTGTFTKNIEQATQTLNFNLYIKCQASKKVSSKFNYCGQCSNQLPYQQVRYCPGTVNALKYFTRFKTTVAAIKQLTITITQSSLSVTQLVYTDNISSSSTPLNLISIQFINI